MPATETNTPGEYRINATGIDVRPSPKSWVNFQHFVVDFQDVTTIWTRLWAVLQIPWFLLVYIIKGKATLR